MITVTRIVLIVLLMCLPATAQNTSMRLHLEECLKESQQSFEQRQYQVGARQVEEAARIVHAQPSAYPEYTAIGLASTALDFLTKESTAAREHGNEKAALRAISAEDVLLRSLSSWDPQNPKWKKMRANYEQELARASQTAPIGGTNGRYAATGPGSDSQYHSFHINPSSLKSGPWGPGLGRARVDWSKLPLPKAGNGNGSGGTNCPNCGHYMAPGVSWCTSCGH